MNRSNSPSSPDPGPDLLDAVLMDDQWNRLHDSLRHEALGAMRRATHARRVRKRVAWTLTGVALAVGLCWQLSPGHPPKAASTSPALITATGIADRTLPLISESEMLALFPSGSCVIAEVDGRKELVFLDPKIAARGITIEP